MHHYFSVLGAEPIRKFAADAAGKSSKVDEAKYPELKADLDRAWNAAKHLTGGQGAAGSNPVSPTMKSRKLKGFRDFEG